MTLDNYAINNSKVNRINSLTVKELPMCNRKQMLYIAKWNIVMMVLR